MGWTGIPCYDKPNTEFLNQTAQDALRSDSYDIIDRSGWLTWNHAFFLCELKPDAKPDNPSRRGIAMFKYAYSGHELRYRIDDDSAGPNEVDCPLRLINAVSIYPPHNEYAANWYKRVRAHHRHQREGNKLLASIANETDNRIVLNNGDVVHYRIARQRRSNVKAYHHPGDHQLYRLSVNSIDLDATQALRRAVIQPALTA